MIRRLPYLFLATVFLLTCSPACHQQEADLLSLIQEIKIDKTNQVSWEKGRDAAEAMIQSGIRDASMEKFYILSLLQTNHSKEALEKALTLHERTPDDSVLNYLIGKLYHDRNQYKQALAYLSKAYELNFNPSSTLILLLSCAKQSDIPEKEIEVYYQALQKHSEDKEAILLYNSWALWRFQQSDYQGALKHLKHALSLEKDPVYLLNRAIVHDRWYRNHSDPQARKMARRDYIDFLGMTSQDDRFRTQRKRSQERVRQLTELME